MNIPYQEMADQFAQVKEGKKPVVRAVMRSLELPIPNSMWGVKSGIVVLW